VSPGLYSAVAAAEDPSPFLAEVVQEQRAQTLREAGTVGVGGKVTHMVITAAGIAKSELGHWDDKIGQPLNPFLPFIPARAKTPIVPARAGKIAA
jgi:hypothetical protein